MKKEQRTKAFNKNSLGHLYSWPMGLWFTIFFVVPLAIIILYSFLKKGLYGGVEWVFSFNAYKQMFNPNYGIVLMRTLKISFISTLITILIALPCGYAMARSKMQTFLLFLVIIPFWTNSLIRIFAWMSILGNDGFINSLLIQVGLTKEHLQLLYNQNAVILVSVYMYLPMQFCLYLPQSIALTFRFWKQLEISGRQKWAPCYESFCQISKAAS